MILHRTISLCLLFMIGVPALVSAQSKPETQEKSAAQIPGKSATFSAFVNALESGPTQRAAEDPEFKKFQAEKNTLKDEASLGTNPYLDPKQYQKKIEMDRSMGGK